MAKIIRQTATVSSSLGLLMDLVAAAVALSPSAAQATEGPCGARYSNMIPLAVGDATRGGASARRLNHGWGMTNIQILPGEGDGAPVLAVSYPAGSVNPGNRGAPLGGAGFHLRAGEGAEARCLSYRLRFDARFDFVRGGKLPGLYGGDAPRGCAKAELGAGFSARLMWRADGDGELYLYAPDQGERCGGSIGRGSWRFPRGRWVGIAQEVVLNVPGKADGVVRMWIDGQLVLDRGGLVLRERAEVRIEGLLFSTFFGGSDASWASAADQRAEFTGFEIWDAPAGR